MYIKNLKPGEVFVFDDELDKPDSEKMVVDHKGSCDAVRRGMDDDYVPYVVLKTGVVSYIHGAFRVQKIKGSFVEE
jgi:hypothetical protein